MGSSDFFGTRSKEAPRSQRFPDTWRSPLENVEIVIWQWFWHRRHVLRVVSTENPSRASTVARDEAPCPLSCMRAVRAAP